VGLVNWAFIYTASGSAASGDVTVVDTGQCRTTFIGVGRPEQAIALARKLAQDGVQLIELCGGFGPIWTSKIIEAIPGTVAVGSVGYGPESVDRVHEIFS
jgi:hypothetical protein